MSIIDRPRRTCAGCSHWSSARKTNPDGYIEAICHQPKAARDHELKRAADICSKWVKRSAVRASALVFDF